MAMKEVQEVLGADAIYVVFSRAADDVEGGDGRMLRAMKDRGLQIENICHGEAFLGVLVECMGRDELHGGVHIP